MTLKQAKSDGVTVPKSKRKEIKNGAARAF